MMTDTRDRARPDAKPNAGAEPLGAHIWYELMTTDPEGAKAFYERVVGWTISESVPEYSGYRMIGRADGGHAGGLLPLSDEMQRNGARPTWLGYLYVPDVDRALEAIQGARGKALMPAMDIPNVGRIAMVSDPDGNPFYIMKPIPPEGQEDGQSDVFSPTAEQRVSWNELTTSDPSVARRFYGDIFGWTSDEFMPMGENGEYRFFAREGTTIGAVCAPMPGAPTGWRYYIRVPSIPKAVEDVRAGGGEVLMGPHEVPGGDHIIIGRDPQGAEFALVGKA